MAIVTAFFIAHWQQSDLRGMKLFYLRRLRLVRMRATGDRRQDAFERIICPRRSQSQDVAQVWRGFVAGGKRGEAPIEVRVVFNTDV